MSDALRKSVSAEQNGLRMLVGSFTLAAGGPAVSTKQNRAGLWDVAKTGTGIYTVTLVNKYYTPTVANTTYPMIQAWVQGGSATVMPAAFATAGLWAPSTRSFPIFTGSTNGTPADLAIAAALTICFNFINIETMAP